MSNSQGCDWKRKGPEEKLGQGCWGPGGKAPESSWILEHCSINLHGVIF